MNRKMKGRSTSTVKLAEPMASFSMSKLRTVPASAPVAVLLRVESCLAIRSNSAADTFWSTRAPARSTKMPRRIFMIRSKMITQAIIAVSAQSDSMALFGTTRS